MSATGVVLIIAGGLLAAVFLAGLIVLFVLLMARVFGGKSGGWRKLADRYPSQGAPRGKLFARETIQIGVVTYKRMVTAGVADEGLYLSVWRRVALIPWREVVGVGRAVLYWQSVPMLVIGEPPVATVAVSLKLFEEIQKHLPPGLLSQAADGRMQ
ncbi:MAG: hypothetical protein K1X57_15570 [Gemmataceae bacterium]|nr:hypothetical protein [Gemmataceae bacterium]